MKTFCEKHYNLVLVLLFFAAVILRIILFGEIPAGINQDEAMAAMDAKALAAYGTDRYGMFYPVHLTAWKYGQMSALLSYCMVPFIKLLGFHTVAVRLPILLASLCGLVFLYLTVRKCFSKNMALFVLFLGAICPWHIMQSRWSLDCNLFPHLFIIGFYFLLCGLEKRRYLYLSMVFFALCIYSYGVAVYTVPVFLFGFALYLLIKKRIAIKELFWAAVIFGVISLPELLTMLINMVKLPSINTPFFTIPFFPESIRSNDILFLNFSFMQLLRNIGSLITQVFLQFPDNFFNTIAGFGPLYHISIPFSIIGIIALVRRLFKKSNSDKTYITAISMFFAMGIWLGMVTYEVNINRIAVIFYPMLILCALGIREVVKRLPRLLAPVTAVFILCAGLFSFQYFTSYAEESRSYYNKDFMEAVQYADEMPTEQLYITCDLDWQQNPQMSEILTQYALDMDARYYQELTDELNGRSLRPYSERYHYAYPEYYDFQPAVSTAYVIYEEEKSLFDDSFKEIASYGKYRILTHGGTQP